MNPPPLDQVSATFGGYVSKSAIHAAYCGADVVVQFPERDRNPRVPYEAAEAERPFFVSEEAHLAGELLSEPWVGHASFTAPDAAVAAAFANFTAAVTGADQGAAITSAIRAFKAQCLSADAVFGAVERAVAAAAPAARPAPARREAVVVRPDLAGCF